MHQNYLNGNPRCPPYTYFENFYLSFQHSQPFQHSDKGCLQISKVKRTNHSFTKNSRRNETDHLERSMGRSQEKDEEGVEEEEEEENIHRHRHTFE